MAFTTIPTRSTTDANSFADINSLMDNTQYFRDAITVSSNNVGVGLTPGEKVDILSGNYRITHNATTNSYGLQFWRSGAERGRFCFLFSSSTLECQSDGVIVFLSGGETERARIDSSGNFKIGGTAGRGTTVGTYHLDIFDGTAPAGTLTNGVSFYSNGGEAYVMNSGGTATQISPHSKDGHWHFNSKNTKSGKRLVIDVEKILRFVNDHFDLDYVHEYMEGE